MRKLTNTCTTPLTPDGSGNDFCNEGFTPCGARRYSDGTITGNRCGEPCSWIMGKAGHGEPPWENLPGNIRKNPTTPD